MPSPCDPIFADVVLLLDCDGTNGSTVFTDLSNAGNVITAHGNGQVSTAHPMFGTGAFEEPDGSTSAQSYIATPITSGGPLDILEDASGDFTIEFWAWYDSTNSGAEFICCDYGDDLTTFGGVSGIKILLTSFFGGILQVQPTIPSWSALSGGIGVTADAWHHVAVTRRGSNGYLWLDGIQQGGNTTNWVGYAGPVAGSSVTFGWSATVSGGIGHGQIDEIRVTKGVARYTSNFTPPTQPFGLACIVDVTVPDVTLQTLSGASAILTPVPLTLGAVTYLHSATVPVGEIIYQNPLAGASVPSGSAVTVSVSIGPASYFVPYVIGDTNAAAATAIASAGLTVGAVTTVYSLFVPAGTVINQNPVAGTAVPLSYPVDLVESAGPPPPPPIIAPFDVDLTVISQYQNSPTLLALVEDMAQYVDPRTNLETFYSYVWNVDTAVGFGLDIWGRIVGVSRLLQISGANNVFGFWNSDVPLDWQPFNQAPFDGGPLATSSYYLPDDAFRVLILTKALANIVSTTAPALNQLLQNLFPGRGVCYVLDNGGMSMTFVFEFPLTNIEFAILTQSGALPHPAGVSFNVVVVPTTGTFGFKQQPTALPFNQGTFYKR